MNSKAKNLKRKQGATSQTNKTKRPCRRNSSATVVNKSSDSSSSDDDAPSDWIVSSDTEDEISDISEDLDSDEEVEVVVINSDWGPVTGHSLQKFSFTETPTSPVINANTKPIEVFNMFVNDEVYDLVVTQTNLNARKKVSSNIKRCSRMKKWKDTNIDENEEVFWARNVHGNSEVTCDTFVLEQGSILSKRIRPKSYGEK